MPSENFDALWITKPLKAKLNRMRKAKARELGVAKMSMGQFLEILIAQQPGPKPGRKKKAAGR